jgi:hypothetical protein
MLMHADGHWFTTIDGRSYQAFLKTADKRHTQTETGSTETKDLVIEWRKCHAGLVFLAHSKP